MNKKILKFLKEAGYEDVVGEPAALQLIHFFEEKYGVNLMVMLEREWIEEQMTHDMSHQDFEVIRDVFDEQYLGEFDKTIERIEAFEA